MSVCFLLKDTWENLKKFKFIWSKVNFSQVTQKARVLRNTPVTGTGGSTFAEEKGKEITD